MGKLEGIFTVADITDEIREFYKNGVAQGFKTGYACLDLLYRPQPGYMTIVTGIPGHGKSEVVDGVLVNMAMLHGWKFLLFSPENYPLSRHFVKLAEKYVGKPFKSDNKLSGMSKGDIKDAMVWMDAHFAFQYPPEDKTKLDDLLEVAQAYKEQFGLDGFVIDPWNEIDHLRPAGLSETEYISRSLTKIRRFARQNMIHVWVIAHPAKLSKNKEGIYDPPTPYDISGSAHWRNKADYCLTMHRPDMMKNQVEVYVQKVKFKTLGKLGKCDLDYDWLTGRLKDPEAKGYGLRSEVEEPCPY